MINSNKILNCRTTCSNWEDIDKDVNALHCLRKQTRTCICTLLNEKGRREYRVNSTCVPVSGTFRRLHRFFFWYNEPKVNKTVILHVSVWTYLSSVSFYAYLSIIKPVNSVMQTFEPLESDGSSIMIFKTYVDQDFSKNKGSWSSWS